MTYVVIYSRIGEAVPFSIVATISDNIVFTENDFPPAIVVKGKV